MKNFHHKFFDFKPLLLMGIFCIFTLLSCNREEENITPQANNEEALLDFLESTGFERSSIVLQNGEFIIDNDILIAREEVEKYLAQGLKEIPEGKSDHWRGPYLVSNTYVTNIRIFIESSVPSAWGTATRNAMTQWNNVGGSRLRFSEVSNRNSADIRVNTAYANENWVARAYLPSYNGRPGHTMTINTRYNSLDSGRKLFTMVHEMGHTFGLYHTDQTQGIFIQGTPTTDANSVMNSYILPWNGFTNGDVAAVRILYPQ